MNNYKYPEVIPISTTIDIDKILEKHPPVFSLHKDNPHKTRDRIAFVIGSYFKSANLQTTYDEDDYVSVCTEILKDVVRNYREILDYLTGEVKMFDCDEIHLSGSKCYGYKLTEKYKGGKIMWYRVFDVQFQRSIRKYKRPAKLIKQYNFLYRNLDLLSYDKEMARHIIKDVGIVDHQSNYLINATTNELRSFFTSSKVGRLYTDVSFMKRELRDSLLFGGEQAIKLDLKNSAYYMHYTLFDSGPNTKTIIKLLSEINPTLKQDLITLNSKPVSMRCKISDELSYTKEINQYRDLVSSGKLYEFCAQTWKKALNMNLDRDQAKAKIQAVINRPPHDKCAYKDALKKIWPSIMNTFDYVNSGYYRTRKGKGKRKLRHGDLTCPLARFYMKLEAKTILDKVCPALEESEIPVITIHDCLMIQPKSEIQVRAIMNNVITEQIGITPKIDKEKFYYENKNLKRA